MRNSFFFLLIFISSCNAGKQVQDDSTVSSYQPYIDSIQKSFAPDKRTVLFSVQPDGKILRGETNVPAAKQALMAKLNAAGLAFTDSISVLPGAQLQKQTKAVVTLSVANLRTNPEHKAELATQATMGTPLQVLKKQRGWYLVQTPDKYLAWVDGDAIARMDEATFNQWQQKPKLIYTNPFGFVYDAPGATATVSDVVYGNVLAITGTENNFYQVTFPDGRKGFVPQAEAQLFAQWRSSRQPSTNNMTETAKRMLGIPYLWGGTSFKGVDCSGFTKTVYFMNGLVLPRDASQQVMVGEEIDTRSHWNNMQPGDLLFFGSKADGNKNERVVHVGMWIGNNEFIHAAGKVRVSSMDPAAANYDSFEHNRFLRAKRISPEASLMDLRVNSLYEN